MVPEPPPVRVEPFSAGYVRTPLVLQPYEAGPVIDLWLHDHLASTVYDGAGGPITVKVGLRPGPHFAVEGEVGVPPDVLGLPADRLADLPDGTGSRDVFVMKPGYRSALGREVGATGAT